MNWINERIRAAKNELADAMEREISRNPFPGLITPLQEKHLKRCKFVSSRKSLLKRMPANGVAAEIGVYAGDFSEDILSVSLPSRLYLIDSWEKEFAYLKDTVEKKFAWQIKEKTVEIIRDNSINALSKFKDEVFDWVYLDSDHSYPYTYRELEVLDKKIKSNGIICGHDYTLGVWYQWNQFGVMQSVNEFCVKYNYEIVYFSFAPGMFNSYAIQKIK